MLIASSPLEIPATTNNKVFPSPGSFQEPEVKDRSVSLRFIFQIFARAGIRTADLSSNMKFLAPKCLLVISTLQLLAASHSRVSAAFAASSALLDDKFKPADAWNSGSGQPAPAAPAASSTSGSSGGGSSDAEDKCYDEKLKKPIACVPDFVNAAYGLPVSASSTCGEPARQFCSLTKDR